MSNEKVKELLAYVRRCEHNANEVKKGKKGNKRDRLLGKIEEPINSVENAMAGDVMRNAFRRAK